MRKKTNTKGEAKIKANINYVKFKDHFRPTQKQMKA